MFSVVDDVEIMSYKVICMDQWGPVLLIEKSVYFFYIYYLSCLYKESLLFLYSLKICFINFKFYNINLIMMIDNNDTAI